MASGISTPSSKIFVAADFDKTLTNFQTDGGLHGDTFRDPAYLAGISALPAGHPEKNKLISNEALNFIRAVIDAGHDFGIASFNDGDLGGERYIRAALAASGLEPHYLDQLKIVSRRNNIDPEDGEVYEARNKNEHLKDLLGKFARPEGYYSARYFYDDNKRFVDEAKRRGYLGTVAPERGLAAFWAGETVKLASMIPGSPTAADAATAAATKLVGVEGHSISSASSEDATATPRLTSFSTGFAGTLTLGSPASGLIGSPTGAVAHGGASTTVTRDL